MTHPAPSAVRTTMLPMCMSHHLRGVASGVSFARRESSMIDERSMLAFERLQSGADAIGDESRGHRWSRLPQRAQPPDRCWSAIIEPQLHTRVADANKGPGIIVVASYRGTIVASFFNAPGATVRNRSALSTI